MAITLKNQKTGEVVALPPELYWRDEFSWSKVKSATKYGLTGALLVAQSVAHGGRPMTIGAEADMDWCPRHIVDTLFKWCETPSLKILMTITTTHTEIDYNVMFDSKDQAIKAEPVRGYESADPKEDFHLELKFIEVLT